jgi:hypothetical protein
MRQPPDEPPNQGTPPPSLGAEASIPFEEVGAPPRRAGPFHPWRRWRTCPRRVERRRNARRFPAEDVRRQSVRRPGSVVGSTATRVERPDRPRPSWPCYSDRISGFGRGSMALVGQQECSKPGRHPLPSRHRVGAVGPFPRGSEDGDGRGSSRAGAVRHHDAASRSAHPYRRGWNDGQPGPVVGCGGLRRGPRPGAHP